MDKVQGDREVTESNDEAVNVISDSRRLLQAKVNMHNQ